MADHDTLSLTGEQSRAIGSVLQSLHAATQGEPDAHKPTIIGGMAGTGKTTLISALCAELSEHGVGYVVGTPTGKAASVLRAKGVQAATIHKLCYQIVQGGGDVLSWDFIGVAEKLGELEEPEVLIIDEASMVDQRIHDDLMKSGMKLVYIGDYAQLPPVGKDPGIMQQMDVTLRTVHRQKDHLLEVAYAFREGRVFGRHFTQHPEVARYARLGTDKATSYMDEADAVLCGTNATRHRINAAAVKRDTGVDPDRIPKKGDDDSRIALARRLQLSKARFKVVCMSNNYESGIMNGETGTLRLVDQSYADHLFVGDFQYNGDDAMSMPITVNVKQLFADANAVGWREDGVKFDFGYALTVHKAQGSEWPHVCVVDHRNRNWTDEMYRRWRYTAATRAQQRLTWLGNI